LLYPGRTPTVLVQPEAEHCCRCAALTRAGIYIRAHPNSLDWCPRKGEIA
jgi:hypothetical protein